MSRDKHPLNLFYLNFVSPSAAPPFHRCIHPLVLLPQFYSLSLRVPPLLSYWRAGLQLCTSPRCFTPSSRFLPFLHLPHSLSSIKFPINRPPIHTHFFFKCVFLRCSVVVCAPPSGCGGEHHEGEDAQERRAVVVLLARQKQQQQIGDCFSPRRQRFFLRFPLNERAEIKPTPFLPSLQDSVSERGAGGYAEQAGEMSSR